MWWIENQFDYVIRLDQMAADIHLSKSYAYRIFHQEIDSIITERPVRTEYMLSRKGTELGRALSAVERWADKWL